VPGITPELVAAALSALDAGLYRDANEEQALLAAEEAAAAVTGIQSATPVEGILEVMVNGRLCRVLDIDGTAAEAIAAGVVPRPLV